MAVTPQVCLICKVLKDIRIDKGSNSNLMSTARMFHVRSRKKCSCQATADSTSTLLQPHNEPLPSKFSMNISCVM